MSSRLSDCSIVIVGRLLVGFAVGTITGVAPVFGAEIAKVRCTTPRCSIWEAAGTDYLFYGS